MIRHLLKYALTAAALLATIPMQSEKFLFIGDSVTDGNWGSPKGWPCPSEKRSQTDMNHIYGHGYMEMIAAHFQGEYPEGEYVFFNRGISGNTLTDLESRWDKDALALRPDVINVLIGTNDIHYWLENGADGDFDYDGWEARYRNLLDKSLESNPKMRFVLCTPFVARVGKIGSADSYGKRAEAISRLDEIVKRLATDYNASLVDFDSLLRDLYNTYPDVDTSYWIWDGIHPTPAAHYRMAQLWISTYQPQK